MSLPIKENKMAENGFGIPAMKGEEITLLYIKSSIFKYENYGIL